MEQLQVMEKALNIQQMAQATGLSAHTLRYYERAGLMMQHVERDEANGYRSYSHQHVAWFEFLKRLRATGMPIRDIQRYTELCRRLAFARRCSVCPSRLSEKTASMPFSS